jgi:hypothetical protein
MTPLALHRKLEKLLGEHFDYLGEAWVLIDVLGDIDSLVLRRHPEDGSGSVQQNSYGIPTRRVADTLTLPISDAESGAYSDEVLLLLAGRRRSTGT